MTIYFNKDTESIAISKRKLEILAQHYKQIADVLSSKEVKEVIEKFQGKVYSKRFQTALQKIDKHFYVDTQFSPHLEYNFYDFKERSFNVDYINTWGQADSRTIYLDNYKYTIAMLTKSTILEDRNIIREDLQDISLKNSIDYFKRQHEQLSKQLKELDSIILQYKELINNINEFTDKLQSDLKSEFSMYLTNSK